MDIKTFIFRLIILFSTLSLIGCQSTDKKFFPYQFDTETYQKISGTKKVILVPTQLFDHENAYDKKTYKSLDLAIKTYLEKQGFEVFIYNLTADLWATNKQQVDGLYDPKTGKIIPSYVKGAIKKTLADLRALSGFSVSILPHVQYRPIEITKHSQNKAVWNGVSRRVDARPGDRYFWSQHMATSLAITIVADDFSNPIFRGMGGIDFITKNAVKGRSYFRDNKAFDETPKENISEAIEIAFYPFINSEIVESTMPESYYKMVYRKIGHFMKYPESAREQQLKDQVIVQFKIQPSGKVNGIKVVKPSKYEIFNSQSISSIKAASPFPNPPAKFFNGDVTVEIPFIFQP
jgi:TonB family protein